jgi:hypothetical protein
MANNIKFTWKMYDIDPNGKKIVQVFASWFKFIGMVDRTALQGN